MKLFNYLCKKIIIISIINIDIYPNIFIKRPVINYNIQGVINYNILGVINYNIQGIDKEYIIKDHFHKEWYELLINSYYS